jgi:hypothetical protein
LTPEAKSMFAAARSSAESWAGSAPRIRTERPGASERRGGAASGEPSVDEDEGRELEGGGGPPCARAAAAGDGDSWRWRFFTFVAFTHARPSWTLARCQPQLTPSPEEGPAMLQEAG